MARRQAAQWLQYAAGNGMASPEWSNSVRILLIAYDYPPLASPQSIRWHYLTRELARQGAEVHVLAPALPDSGTALAVPAGVSVHRCSAGGLAGWLARRRRARSMLRPDATATGAVMPPARPVPSLNWKGRLHQRLNTLIGLWCYPDSRGQWRRPARAALRTLLERLRPDVVIGSHEPAVSLELGLEASGGAVWFADLGDPVLAPYTPWRWRRRAGKLEAEVCASAAAISVTTAQTRELLIARHGIAPERIFVLPQGYDDRVTHAAWNPGLPALELGGELNLLYTGRFYPFRRPLALLEAVLAQPRVRLAVAAPEVAPEYLAFADRSGGRIVFLGEQPHEYVLELQRRCDVLVNIGNALAAQTPGKLFEYLGSGKPILHCYSEESDPANALVRTWGRGWVCRNDRADIEAFLASLLASPRERCAELSRDGDAAAEYGWSMLAWRLLQRCGQWVGDRHRA
ncbi:glycosyltransferase [Fulvimonas sp. R45]|uniref:glycosyltransferase n=1 Tax=Fulvimonas sp. R45 TaxID=3045937 RepID=UPI00265E91FE|nr:glycosyltransferase [Fulvimonas sp. R45]MDO1527644.1 glycosyltransferase [Fulvimonas sp. R45]